MESKIFIKRIDENGIQVITIEKDGRLYVDVMDEEEVKEIYKVEF